MTTEAKAVSGDGGIEVTVLKPDDADFNRVHVQPRTAYAPQSGWVMQLAQACAGPQPDGLTPGGQQAYRLLSSEEVVTRAFAIADGVFAELAKRGWSAPVPPFDELRNTGGSVGFLAKAREP
ncbi:MAG: hypothetical protein J2P53_02240 [Bradyrhizobiaceae bacterium]|nr:hypothetical protein [Bradyrhizobiaceae bacterium]